MYIPAAREYVSIEGREGAYFVLAVDREDGIAFVVDLHNSVEVEHVAFQQLSPRGLVERTPHLKPDSPGSLNSAYDERHLSDGGLSTART